MRSFKEFLLEAPIVGFNKDGDWSSGAKLRKYDKASVGILNSEVGVKKIHNAFSKTDFNFNLLFLRSPVASIFGSMKSARDGKINRPFEFVFELIAQYIVTGKITLNRELPKVVKVGNMYNRRVWKLERKDVDEILIREVESFIESEIERILGRCVNKIFVM